MDHEFLDTATEEVNTEPRAELQMIEVLDDNQWNEYPGGYLQGYEEPTE